MLKEEKRVARSLLLSDQSVIIFSSHHSNSDLYQKPTQIADTQKTSTEPRKITRLGLTITLEVSLIEILDNY